MLAAGVQRSILAQVQRAELQRDEVKCKHDSRYDLYAELNRYCARSSELIDGLFCFCD